MITPPNQAIYGRSTPPLPKSEQLTGKAPHQGILPASPPMSAWPSGHTPLLRFGLDPKKFLNNVSQNMQAQQASYPTTLSFEAYLGMVQANPSQHLRNTSQYLSDAMSFYSTGEKEYLGQKIKTFALPNEPWYRPDLAEPGLIGQDLALNKIYEVLRGFAAKPYPERAIMIHGPYGSGKGTLAKTLLWMMDNYSKEPSGKGVRYTLAWHLTPEEDQELGIPAAEHKDAHGQETFEIDTYTNPIFVLPPKDRYQLVQELKAEGKLAPDFNEKYFTDPKRTQLDAASQQILNYLKQKYHGDFSKIASHIVVKRFEYDFKLHKGLVWNSGQKSQQDAVLSTSPLLNAANLPQDLQLTIPYGQFTRANGGVIFLDELSLNWGQYAHLIDTSESGEINIGDDLKVIQQPFDGIIIVSCNDNDLQDASGKPIFEKLRQRLILLPLPYILTYKDNQALYQSIFTNRLGQKSKSLAPHTMEAFGALVTLSALLPVQPSHFEKPLREFLEKKPITLFDKMLLYQGETDPAKYGTEPNDSSKLRFSTEDLAFLREHLQDLLLEYNRGVGKVFFTPFYEGGMGIDPREASNLLLSVARENQSIPCLSPKDVLDSLKQHFKQGISHEEQLRLFIEGFNKEDPQAKLKFEDVSPMTLLAMTERYYKSRVETELRMAMGLTTSREQNMVRLCQYLENLRGLLYPDQPLMPLSSPLVIPSSAPGQKPLVIKGWGYPDPYSTKPNKAFVEEMEATDLAPLIKTNGRSLNEFRQFLLNQTSYVVYSNEAFQGSVEKGFGNILNAMHAKQESDNKQALNDFKSDLLAYLDDHRKKDFLREMRTKPDGQQRIERLESTIQRLEKDFGYCGSCLPKLLPWALS